MTNKHIIKNGCSIVGQPFSFILAVLFVLTISCQSSDQSSLEEERTLFSVNDISVTVFDFETKYVQHLINTGRNDTKEERYSYVNQMVDNLLLAERSSEKGNLDHSIYKSAINYHLRKSMMDAYFMDEMDKLLEPSTDDEIRLAYAKKQRKVYVRHLFSIKESELWAPYQRLENGESFVDVANDFYETAAYDSTAGYLGPINFFGVDDAFAEAAYSTNQGEYTKPIRSLYGYHIIYVEFIEFPAMLTESDYQYRKSGITSQLRLRKQSLVSNSYVRDLMETLLVEVDSDNVLALQETIKNLSSELIVNTTQNPEERPSDIWDDQRLDELKASFDENAVLTTYLFGGERVSFTFGDYVKWLPYLSFSESINRTGASIGRSLRNEVLFQLSSREGYADDARVKKEVRKRGYDVLSELYQYQLTLDAIADESDIEVPNTFKERLIKNRQFQTKAAYFKILASDLNNAEKIKKELLNGKNAESYSTYVMREFEEIEPSEFDYYLVKDALLNTPVVGHSKEDGYMVFNLIERENTEITSNTENVNLDTRYKVYKSINDEVIDLRKEATIQLDTLLFNDIYNLNKKKKEASKE